MALTDWIHRIDYQSHDLTAIICGESKLTYCELKDSVLSLATAISDFGLPEGSSVCILSQNGANAVIAFWAALWAGFVPNFMNTRWTSNELSLSLQDCAAGLLLVDEQHMDTGKQLLHDCPSLNHLVFLEGAGETTECSHNLEQLLKTNGTLEDHSGSAYDDAFINYTGGTTGVGKGVVHSHAKLTQGLNVCFAEDFYRHGYNFGLVIPLFHISGIMSMTAMLRSRGTLVMIPVFDPSLVLKLIETQRINSIMMVPTMCRMLLADSEFTSYDLQSLKSILYGGSPIDESLLQNLLTTLPSTELFQVYGQTECAPVTFLHPSDHLQNKDKKVLQSVGSVGHGIEVKFIDKEGNTLADGEVGEICFTGDCALMSRYLNQPELTETTLQQGWCHSGDVGHMKNGYLYVLDRLKDMIISGGENVYSTEVESVLSSHTLVKQCAVVGARDEKWGERVHAFLVLDDTSENATELLSEYCREHLAGYKIPRSFSIIDSLPLTSVGKINKVELKKMLSQ